MRTLWTAIRILSAVLLAATVGYFLAMKRGWLRPDPRALATVVVLLCCWLLLELGWAVFCAVRRRLRGTAAAGRILLPLGLFLAFAGGLVNWAYSLQGFIILGEGEEAPFFRGEHLQAFDAGPLSDLEEMQLVLRLDRVKLEPLSDGQMAPASHLRIGRIGQEPRSFVIRPGETFADGTLRFSQGVFGYSVHLVILEGTTTLFDKEVPFMTRRDEEGQVIFLGDFIVREHGLQVRGEVALDSLNDELRGHPRLSLAVERDGKMLGFGFLRMGHFADLEAGHRVGFSGLKKWAEIDIQRKHYPTPIFIGAGFAALALPLLLLAAILRRRRRR